MNLNKILPMVAILFTLTAGVFGATTYFATASDLIATQKTLDTYISSERFTKVQDRIWTIEDRYELNDPVLRVPLPQTTKEELRKLRIELEKLKVILKLD